MEVAKALIDDIELLLLFFSSVHSKVLARKLDLARSSDFIRVLSVDDTAELWNPFGQVVKASVIEGVQEAKGTSNRPSLPPNFLGSLVESQLVQCRLVTAIEELDV